VSRTRDGGGSPPIRSRLPGMTRVVRVGVTGHRTFDDRSATEIRVRQALARVLRLAGDGAGGAAPRLEVISAIAEGADRLVAREALAMPGTTLLVVLPFPVDDYAQDFHTEESLREYRELLSRAAKVEVMPPSPSREAGYERQGRWVVDHSDAVVALWDGAAGRGRGGTAEIVAYAADKGVPLSWVRVTRP
jgi:hypothetical protein